MFHASRESSLVKIYVHISLKFRSNLITMIEYKKVQEDKQRLILYIQSVPYHIGLSPRFNAELST